MDAIEDDDDTRYHPHQGYGYMHHWKPTLRVSPFYEPLGNDYGEDDNNDGEEGIREEDEDDEDDVGQTNIQTYDKHVDDNEGEEEYNANGGSYENCDDSGDDSDGGEDDDDDSGDDDDEKQKGYIMEIDNDVECQPKKQKLKSLISTYEFAPHVPAPSTSAPSVPKPSFDRNSLADWTEHETFVLLDVLADWFLQRGSKSLQLEEWQEVAEKVSKVSSMERTDTQCRHHLNTLKKKYEKEKVRCREMNDGASKWVYFKRMDKIMSSSPQQAGLSCGLNSEEYVSTNSRIYSDRTNGLDETRSSPQNTKSTGDEGSDGPHAKRGKKGRDSGEASSFRLLADSLHKFSNVYEKIENDRRHQMVELEKMRMDFQKEIETERRHILEKLQNEISKLEQTDDESDGSSENGM
ncbi:putative transcription factor MYB family [Lupinus albus]|uniref:Putative transcription factor MYB family n=1 Tax=Lupinus albus TaxID=3870 RepID=A0A6A4NNB0_LUPAL|nr:putative transcription factor MYB family [Lupinus albus]